MGDTKTRRETIHTSGHPTTRLADVGSVIDRCRHRGNTVEVQMIRFQRRAVFGLLLASVFALGASLVQAQSMHTSKRFSGAKVNEGTVTHLKQNGANVLRLSADFKVPDTPDPHWQVIDSSGNVYLLQRLGIKDNKVNTQITLPAFIRDIAKVQIYCAWAEAVLGETTFDATLTLN
jgi:hypothetical protein